MTRVEKYSADILGWQRQPGPLRVWRVVDGRKENEDGTIQRFSIQEVPEDRYDDVLDLMYTIFLRDEPICESSDVVNNPIVVDDFRKIWSIGLEQGTTIGAFLVEENNPRPVLAGVNMVFVQCEAVERAFKESIEFRDDITKKILVLVDDLETIKNPTEVFKVDNYLTAFGLCVHPRYRGQGLGFEILSARDEMSVAYDIPATATVFTAPAAQKEASRAGMEVLIERDFVDVKNEDGTEVFPGIKSKCIKLMGKKFCHSPSAE